MATNIPQDDFHKTGLRLPKDLHARLHAAAAESGRSYNSEILDRLEKSFSVQAGADWELRVALHINEVRLETVQTHRAMAASYLKVLEERLRETARSGAAPGAIRDLQDEIAKAKDELAQVEDKRATLIGEAARLDRARKNSDRHVLSMLDKIADGAMQDDLEALHTLELRVGSPAQSHHVEVVSPEARKNALLAVGMDAYKAVLDEALTARDAQLRTWWMNEFGYDPQAPKIEREQSKGPRRSPNARRSVPKKPAK